MEKLAKILFVIPSVDSGGIETYLLRFLKLKKSVINPYILVRGAAIGSLLDEYMKLSIPIFYMPLGYINPSRFFKYYLFFKRNNFDAICDFNGNFAGLTVFLAKIAGIKKRITFYRQGRNHFDATIPKRIYNTIVNRMVNKYSTKILSNSNSALRVFFKNNYHINDHRFRVIYNGIDINDFRIQGKQSDLRFKLGIDENAFVIGHVGRLDKSKNHKTILRVAEKAIKKNPDIFLILCGSGTEKLKDVVISLGIAENVRLLGYRSDIPYIMSIFDVFYFPSITEGQPNSLLEAMAAGIPVITSNIESIKEIMPENSIMIDPFDIESVLAFIDEISRKKPGTLEDVSAYIENNFNAADRFNDFLQELI